MPKILFSFLLLFPVLCNPAWAQQSDKILNYIATYKDVAISEMKRTGVPAAITLAQGIHESGAGAGRLVQASNNHFGIKCKTGWSGPSIKHDDDARGECFRKYASAEDSYRDHSDFLKNSQRYASLFLLNPLEYEAWAAGLKKAGYATNPRYAEILVKTIEDYSLQQYTLLAMEQPPEKKNDLFDTHALKADMATAGTEIIPAVTIPVQYPEGVFNIHETKVVFATRGTSYLALAKEYQVDLGKIFEFNELPRTELLDKDRLIYLQRKRKTGKSEFHIVQPGESLHDIAQQEAIRLESLYELNWLREGETPAVGEKLSLQKKSTTIPRLALNSNVSLLPSLPAKIKY